MLALVGTGAVALALTGPTSAHAADGQPCGPQSSRTVGSRIVTQFCPIYLPGGNPVPVARFDAAGQNPRNVGKLVAGGNVNWFLCQRRGPVGSYKTYRNDWWALTLSDDDRRGWVNQVYFSGGNNFEADGGLRRCGAADLEWARSGGAGVPQVPGTPPAPVAPPPPPPPVDVAAPEPLKVGMYWTTSYRRKRVRILRLFARRVSPEARIELRCRSRRKGCRFRKKRLTSRHLTARRTKKGGVRIYLNKAVRRLRLRRGAVLDVRFTAPGRVGRLRHLKVVKMRKRIKGRRRVFLGLREDSLCLSPTTGKPQSCPS